jgi:hypothetical protein
MLDSAVLCSLRCQSLLDDRGVDPGLALVEIHAAVARFDGIDVLVDYTGCDEALPLLVYLDSPPRLAHAARNGAFNF